MRLVSLPGQRPGPYQPWAPHGGQALSGFGLAQEIQSCPVPCRSQREHRLRHPSTSSEAALLRPQVGGGPRASLQCPHAAHHRIQSFAHAGAHGGGMRTRRTRRTHGVQEADLRVHIHRLGRIISHVIEARRRAAAERTRPRFPVHAALRQFALRRRCIRVVSCVQGMRSVLAGTG